MYQFNVMPVHLFPSIRYLKRFPGRVVVTRRSCRRAFGRSARFSNARASVPERERVRQACFHNEDENNNLMTVVT